MISKTGILLAIFFVQGVLCETVQDVIDEYNLLLQKHYQIAQSKMYEYKGQYETFKEKLNEQFSETIDSIADQLVEIEANITVNKTEIDSRNKSDCFDMFLYALDNLDVNLRDCHPTENFVTIQKELKFMKYLGAMAVNNFSSCQETNKEDDRQIVEMKKCMKTNFQEFQSECDNLLNNVASNLVVAEITSSICLKKAEFSTISDGLGIAIDLYSCLDESEPEPNLQARLETASEPKNYITV